MKKFIKKILIWLIPLVVLHLWLGSFADGNTDDNYRHFTQKSSNIIMGDSRGSQAVVPDILNKNFPTKDFDNFSLNITYSPYGDIYLKALQRKIEPRVLNGIFILTVDPWNLSQDKKFNGFSEEKSPLNNMLFYNIYPNYEYLIKNFNRSWFHIYRDRETLQRSNTYLHQNGWLEVNVSMEPEELKKREEAKVVFYRQFASGQQLSQERLAAFKETIRFLKNHGDVYIVRIGAGARIMEIENAYAPDFDHLMENIASEFNIDYFDFSENPGNYKYTDGNHMYKESSKIFTQQVADSIKKSQSE